MTLSWNSGRVEPHIYGLMFLSRKGFMPHKEVVDSRLTKTYGINEVRDSGVGTMKKVLADSLVPFEEIIFEI